MDLGSLASRLVVGLIAIASVAASIVVVVVVVQLVRIRQFVKTPTPGWTRVEMDVASTLVDEGFTVAEAATAIMDTRDDRSSV